MLKKLCITASFPVFLLAARFVPFNRLPSTCVFINLTGYPCPSCGMTRSVMALVRLDFDRAVHMNPFGLVFVGIFGLWWVNSLYELAAGRRTRIHNWAARHINLLALIGIAVLFLFSALRIVSLMPK